MAAVRKIRLYASGVGKLPETPCTVDLCICSYIPAIDGPIDWPIKLRSKVMPSAIPANWIGVDNKTMLKAPMNASDNPAAIIASVIVTI